MSRTFLLFAGLALAGWTAAGWADTVYRCVGAGGKVSYRDAPCANDPASGNEERVLHLVNPPPVVRSAPVRPRIQPKATPREAVFRLFYDPRNAPVEHSASQVASLIAEAGRIWSRGCQVTIEYGGTAEYDGPGSASRVMVRWNPAYMTASHPAMEGIHIAGTGSLHGGITLRPRMSDEYLRYVMVHELGHVLGIAHRHKDLASVMSYQATPDLSRAPQPTPGDYQACNLAMKQQFGVDVNVPQGGVDPGAGMSDREVLHRKYDPPQ